MNSGRRLDSVWTLIALIEVAVAITTLEVERGLGLPRLMPLIVVGFAIHAWLPLRHRVSFFLLLGVLGAVLMFGPAGAAMLLAGVLLFLGACHLPVGHAARVGVVVLLAVGAAVLRPRLRGGGAASAVAPILASMLMFRLIIYLYDIRHERKPVPFQKRLAYFFLLPNLCFPLFPVVDYQRFVHSHYAREDADAIHRKGVAWMLLGALQVLAYRVLQLYVVPEPDAIQNAVGVALYVSTSYLQYVRISGMFHIAVGILCLFGFDLPPTNRWYFFADDYADLWRRANSYWKEFLQKVVYFPVFMRYRKAGMVRGLVLATLAVFFASWALHIWQWFWLRGEVVFSYVDMAFWGLVGAAVVVASVRASGERPAPVVRSPFGEAIVRTRNTASLFVVACFLWSLWASESLAQWFSIMAQARHLTGLMVVQIAGVIAGVVVLGFLLSWLHAQGRLPNPDLAIRRRPVLVATAGALMLTGVTTAGAPASQALAWTVEPSGVSLGYYEGLLGGSALGGVGLDEELFEATTDLRRFRLRASSRCSRNPRTPCTTNEHGMRDQSVSRSRVPGVLRIALLGSSPEQGFGLADGREYAAVLDERLGPSVEVLNFGVTAYGPVNQVGAVEPALGFEPDMVIYVTHCGAEARSTMTLLETLERDLTEGHPFPAELVDFRPPAFEGSNHRRMWLRSQVGPLTRWAYARIADRARSEGAVPLWVYLPLPVKRASCSPGVADAAERWARDAGFETRRLSDAMYGGRWETELVGDRVGHPNEAGSVVIGEHLAERLQPWVEQLRSDEPPHDRPGPSDP